MATNNATVLPNISIGIVVQDLAASQAFYKDVMKMELVVNFSVSKAESEAMGYSDGRPFDIYLYKTVETATATHLKLCNFNLPQPPDEPLQLETIARPPQTGIDGYAGVNYISFLYPTQKDLDKATNWVRECGVDIIGSISNSAFSGTYFRDPNGIFIELLFVPPPPPKKK